MLARERKAVVAAIQAGLADVQDRGAQPNGQALDDLRNIFLEFGSRSHPGTRVIFFTDTLAR